MNKKLTGKNKFLKTKVTYSKPEPLTEMTGVSGSDEAIQIAIDKLFSDHCISYLSADKVSGIITFYRTARKEIGWYK